jgi:hypothetical protein
MKPKHVVEEEEENKYSCISMDRLNINKRERKLELAHGKSEEREFVSLRRSAFQQAFATH